MSESEAAGVARRPKLDLRRVELGRAVARLREWGSWLVAELLAEGSEGVPAAESVREIAWALAPWPPRRAADDRALARLAVASASASSEAPRRSPLAVAVAGSALEREAAGTGAARAESAPPPGMPRWLWPAAGRMAWEDPAFRFEVMLRARRWLVERELLVDDPVPAIKLRSELWWALLELVAIPRWRDSLSPREIFWWDWRSWWQSAVGAEPGADVEKLLDRLGGVARRIWGGGGWAGFWEQWFVGRAVVRFGPGLERAPVEVRSGLLRLPLLADARFRPFLEGRRSPRPAIVLEEAPRAADLVRDDWESERPEWFARGTPLAPVSDELAEGERDDGGAGEPRRSGEEGRD